MYTPVPVVERNSIGPGGKVVIDVYISGTGPVQDNKLLIALSSTELIGASPTTENPDWGSQYLQDSEERSEEARDIEDDTETVEAGEEAEANNEDHQSGTIAYRYGEPITAKNDGEEEAVGYLCRLVTYQFSGTSTRAIFPPEDFEPTEDRETQPHGLLPVGTEMEYRGLEDEDDIPDHLTIPENDDPIAPSGHPPLRLEFSTDENVTPGEYEVYFIFTYVQNMVTKQASRSANIHVQTWAERNNWKLRMGAIGLSVVIAFSGLVTMIVNLLTLL